MADCCQLVGSLTLDNLLGCVISINVSSKLELLKQCANSLLIGATLGSVSITGYAAPEIHVGCPGRAGVSVQWMKRLDCDAAKTYFLAAGEGPSYVAGDIKATVNGSEQELAVINNSVNRSYPTISASSSSGPAAIYMKTNQTDGYGLTYVGHPIAIDTSLTPYISDPMRGTRTISINGESRTVYSMVLPNFGIGQGPMYLQNFSLEMNPGELPVATYSFAFVIEDDTNVEIPLIQPR